MWKKLLMNPYILGLAALLGVFIVYKSWTRITLFFNKMKVSNELATRAASGAVVEVNLQEIADEIYISFYEYYFFFEDEERAIASITRAGRNNVAKVAELYGKTGHNLYLDFVKYLPKEKYDLIKNLFI